jgi:hypothetical protein
MGYALDGVGFDFRQREENFLFSINFKTAMGPNLPPIQWVLGALSLGIKQPRREADHSHPVPSPIMLEL